MEQIDWIMYLTAASLYAVSSVIYIYCFVSKKQEKLDFAVSSAVIGLLFHSISIAIRWVETGHGPYITMFETLSKDAWFSVLIFLIAQHKIEKIRIGGSVVMPVTFLLMGIGSTYSRDILPIPASLRSYWLVAHAGFASMAFGSILVAVGVAALYLLKERRLNNPVTDLEGKVSLYDRLPPLKVMDELMYRFVTYGLIFLTIMIGAGAIWANQTWGRYWGWDPIETWSLITWFIYGICLHLRMNAGWTGRKIAWFIILSIFILAFSSFGVGYVYSGLHTNYLTS